MDSKEIIYSERDRDLIKWTLKGFRAIYTHDVDKILAVVNDLEEIGVTHNFDVTTAVLPFMKLNLLERVLFCVSDKFRSEQVVYTLRANRVILYEFLAATCMQFAIAILSEYTNSNLTDSNSPISPTVITYHLKLTDLLESIKERNFLSADELKYLKSYILNT